MKIVDRKTFLSLPANTLYSEYVPCIQRGLYIKGETLENGNDFYLSQIVDAGPTSDVDIETGESFQPNIEAEGRDGQFDDTMAFAVWEKADVAQLIARLCKCL